MTTAPAPSSLSSDGDVGAQGGPQGPGEPVGHAQALSQALRRREGRTLASSLLLSCLPGKTTASGLLGRVRLPLILG